MTRRFTAHAAVTPPVPPAHTRVTNNVRWPRLPRVISNVHGPRRAPHAPPAPHTRVRGSAPACDDTRDDSKKDAVGCQCFGQQEFFSHWFSSKSSPCFQKVAVLHRLKTRLLCPAIWFSMHKVHLSLSRFCENLSSFKTLTVCHKWTLLSVSLRGHR